MTRLNALTSALQLIEERLESPQGDAPLTPEEVAASCHYSLSSLQKLFRRALHIGVADYIARRRLTLASRALLQTEDTVLDVALRFGYGSHEVFTRAFRRLWGVTPSKFRQERSFADIFPRLLPGQEVTHMTHRDYDVTALYDTLRSLDGTFALVFDTRGLMAINDVYGRAAGDLVIAECLRRIDVEKEEEMVLFRIGGDEFVLLTATADEDAAKQVQSRILAHNESPITCDGVSIPVSMRSGCVRLETASRLNYANLFRTLDGSIRT